MVRLSLAVALLVSTMGTAQTSIPRPPSPDAAAQSDLDQTYLVFFEDGKASLTPQARQILQIAARRAHTMGQVKVRVMLPMASDGTAALLQGRARVVRAELVRDGVKTRSIGNAERPEDVAYANADPAIRAWRDRSAAVKISPLPNMAKDSGV